MSHEVLEAPPAKKPAPNMSERGGDDDVTVLLSEISLSHQNEPSRKKFEVDTRGNRLYERYRPRYLGHGGDQVVYEILQHPDVVVKVSYRILMQMSEWYRPPETIQEEKALLSSLETEVSQQKMMYERLVEHFGREHLLSERVTKMRLPVTPELMKDVFGAGASSFPNRTINMPLVVRLQEVVSGRILKEGIDVSSGYTEDRVLDDASGRESYASGSTRWLSDHPEGTPFDPDLFLQCQQSRALAQVLDRVSDSPSFRVALRDFVARAIGYTEVTGQILDIAGRRNVVFFQEAGTDTWNYRLIDASFPDLHRGQIAHATEALEDYFVKKRKNLSESKYVALYNALNYTRTVNGFADVLGIQERVNLLNNGQTAIDPKRVDWNDLRRYLLKRVRGQSE